MCFMIANNILLFLAFCILLIFPTNTSSGNSQPERTQKSIKDVEIIKKKEDTLVLECHLNVNTQWIIPDNTQYEDYSNPQHDNRLNIVHLESKSILTFQDLRYSDTGLYKCIGSNSTGQHESRYYVFVKDENPRHLFLNLNDRLVYIYQDRDSYVNCKVTNPEATVKLKISKQEKPEYEYDPKKGFRIPAGALETFKKGFESECFAKTKSFEYSVVIYLSPIHIPPEIDPVFVISKALTVNISPVNATNMFYLNNNLELRCTANYKSANCLWSYPPAENIRENPKTNSIIIESVKLQINDGTFKCTCRNVANPDQHNSSEIHAVVRKTKNLIKFVSNGQVFNPDTKEAEFYANVDIFAPEAVEKEEIKTEWYHTYSTILLMKYMNTLHRNTINVEIIDEVEQSLRTTVVSQAFYMANKQLKLRLKNVRVVQSGDYLLVVKVGDARETFSFQFYINSTYQADVYVTDKDIISKRLDPRYLEKNTFYQVWCVAEGFPLNTPRLTFCPCVVEEGEQCDNNCTQIDDEFYSDTISVRKMNATYQTTLVADLNATKSGTFRCSVGQSTASIPFVVTDIKDAQEKDGFNLELVHSDYEHQGPNDVFQLDSAMLKCKIQKYKDKKGVSWHFRKNSRTKWHLLTVHGTEKRHSSYYSHEYQYPLIDIQLNHSGFYLCNRTMDSETRERNVRVLHTERPSEKKDNFERLLSFRYSSKSKIQCHAQGVPFPKITWSKDGQPLNTERYELSERNDTIYIGTVIAEDEGTYQCTMTNPGGTATVDYQLKVHGLSPISVALLSTGLAVLAVIVIALIVALRFMRLKHQKEMKRLLALQLSLKSRIDMDDTVIPRTPINDQPENLTFKSAFEMPKAILDLEHAMVIDKGYFGVVYDVPLKSSNRLRVAVKQVKSISFNIHDQLICEVKIMIHIGSHVNVLPLIGAVIEELYKGTLWIATELCANGSLLKFLRERSESFIDENQSGRQRAECSSILQNSGFKIARSFNVGTHRFHSLDYGNEELCTADLLCFAYQIANGMAFLDSKNIIHRDLAARNIFITHNNLIRIADFGLSRQGESYRLRKSKGIPLPVAHTAPESWIYLKFSQKSDVWSFGIVLFEIFSLGEHPYPGKEKVSCNQFVSELKHGLRPSFPKYSSNEMNQLMERCWDLKVANRPDYIECQSVIQQQLESHCDSCNESLAMALNDDANKPDFSLIREEFVNHQTGGYEIPISTTEHRASIRLSSHRAEGDPASEECVELYD